MIVETMRCLHGQPIGKDLPIPDGIPGYIFQGWFTERTGGTQITSDWIVDASQTVYAHWILDESAADVENLMLEFLQYDGTDIVGVAEDHTLPSEIQDTFGTSIRDNAFSGQEELVEVTFMNVVTVGKNAFGPHVDEGNPSPEPEPENPDVPSDGEDTEPTVEIIDGDQPHEENTGEDDAGTGGGESPKETPQLKKRELIKRAVKTCVNLAKVSLPKVREIKASAFKNCENLKDLQLNDFVEVIGDNAFESCGQNNIVYLPYATKVGRRAFNHCLSSEIQLDGEFTLWWDGKEGEAPENALYPDFACNCPNLRVVKLYGVDRATEMDEDSETFDVFTQQLFQNNSSGIAFIFYKDGCYRKSEDETWIWDTKYRDQEINVQSASTSLS